MSVLVIGPKEKINIADAIMLARAKPRPWEVLQAIAQDTAPSTLMLRDRKPGIDAVLDAYPSHNVILGLYRAAISFEHQPAGLMCHLSVSSHNSRALPGLEVMKVVCEAFGFSAFPPQRAGRVWVEEFAPRHHAVNVIEIEP